MKTLAIDIIYGESTVDDNGGRRWDKVDACKSIHITANSLCKEEAIKMLDDALHNIQQDEAWRAYDRSRRGE